MKRIFVVLLLFFSCFCTYGQWNSMGFSEESSEDDGDYDGHNLGKGVYDNPTTILLTINGQNVTDQTISSKLGYYIIGYYHVKKNIWCYETVGDIIVTETPVDDATNKINGTKVSYRDADYSGIHTKPDQWGMWETIGLIFDWSDFSSGADISSGDPEGFWEVVIVNKESGYCVSSGQLDAYAQEIKIDLKDPTLAPPTPAGPTLTVSPIIAGCWVEDGTVDLTQCNPQVTPADATVKYYSDAAGTAEITNPTSVAMGTNPASDDAEVNTYYAKAVNSDGESELQSFTVTVYRQPVVDLTLSGATSPACKGTAVTLQATNKNEFPENEYQFYCDRGILNETVLTPVNSHGFNLQESGRYFVYATSVKGCKGVDSVDVEVIPTIPITAITIDGGKEVCEGESITLTASVTGSEYAGAIFVWDNPAGETTAAVTVSPTTQTEYQVKAQLNGCSSAVKSHLVNVNKKPVLKLTDPAAVCGGTVDLTQAAVTAGSASGLTYAYFTDASCTAATAVENATAVATGTYYIQATNDKECKASGSVTATVNPLPEPSITASETEACSGSTVTLTAGPATGIKTYSWSNGMSGQTITPELADGDNTFSLTVTDNNNCEATVTAPVTITGRKAPTVSIAPVTDACSGSEIALTATPVYQDGATQQSVAWTGSTVADASALTTTATLGDGKNTYRVTVTDNHNCTGSEEIEVTGNVLEVKLTANKNNISAGTAVTLTAGVQWNTVATTAVTCEWKSISPVPETTLSGTGCTLTVNPEVTTTYQVKVVKDGCEETKEITIEVTVDPFKVGEITGGRQLCANTDLSGDAMTLAVAAEGGQKEYTYEWTVPAGVTVTATNAATLEITGIDYTQVASGTAVTVTVKDATTPDPQSATKTYYLQITPLPEVSINGEASGSTLQACLNSPLNLVASIAGASGGTFAWEGGGSGATKAADVTVAGETEYKVTATLNGCPAEAAVKVKVNELPDLALTMKQDGSEVTAVCPGTDVVLEASSADVTDAAGYTWSGAASAVTGLSGTVGAGAAGSTATYIVEVTDGTCKNKAEKSLSVHTPGTLSVTASETSVCGGSSVELTANGGSDYSWSGDATGTGATLTVTPDGSKSNYVYRVDGKDTNGCPAKQGSQTIAVLQAPVLELSKTTLYACNGSGTTVDLSAAVDKTKSTAGAELWVDDGTNQTKDTKVTAAGTYGIFLKSGSCQTEVKNVEVIFRDLPDISLSIADDKTNPCSGEEIVLQASSTDTDVTFTYEGTTGTSWHVTPTDPTGTNPVVFYKVVAENTAGCRKEATVKVTVKPLPEVKITAPEVVCEGSEVTLQANGAQTYVWNDKDATAAATLKVVPTQSNKAFTVTGTKDGCSATSEITLDPQPAPKLNVGTLTAGCEGAPIDLKEAVLSELNLTFFDDKKDPLSGSVVTIDASGDYNYYVQGSADGGCPSEMKTIGVTVQPKPVLTFTGNETVCAGETTRITVNGAYSYRWEDGKTDNPRDFTPETAASYKVEGRSSYGCTAEATIELKVNPKPVLAWDAVTDAKTSVVEGTLLHMQTKLTTGTTAPYTYTWKRDAGVTVDFIQVTAAVNPEEFEVYMTDGNGCRSNTLTKSVEVTPAGGVLSVALAASSDGKICQGGMQILTATPANGTPGYTYKWYKNGTEIGGETAAVLVVTDPAVYKVEVKDSGKTPQTASKELTVNPDATRTAPVVQVADMTIPSGTSTALYAEVQPAGTYDYFWSPKEKLAAEQENAVYPHTIVLSADQTYQVYVAGEDGCISQMASGKVKIDDAAFKVTAEADKAEICVGGKAVLTAKVQGIPMPAESDLTYTWLPADGLDRTDGKSVVYTSDASGAKEFFVKVADGSGHVAGTTVKVNVNTHITPVLKLTEKTAVACIGDRVEVTASAGGKVLSYTWIVDGGTPEEGGSSRDAMNAGSHTVKVYATDANGCPTDTVEMDYEIHELPTIAWAADNTWKVDKGSTVTVKASANGGAAGDYTYNWTAPAAGTKSAESCTLAGISTTTTFEVSVTDNATGCTSGKIAKDVEVRAARPAIEFETNVENGLLCKGGVAILDVTAVKGGAGRENVFGDYRYEWYKGGVLLSSETSKSLVVTEVGVYTVKVKDADDRSAGKELTVALDNHAAPKADDRTLTIAKGTDTYLFGSVSGGTPAYSYKWSPAGELAGADTDENPQTVTLNARTEYQYYVTDANGCSSNYATVVVEVTEASDPQLFTVVASVDRRQICAGNTTTLRATPSRPLTDPVYEWSPAAGLSDATSATPVFTPSAAGMYTFTVNVTEGGKSAAAQVLVSVKSTEAPVLSLRSEGDCAGAKVVVDNAGGAVPADGYTWIIDGVRDAGVKTNEYALEAGDGQQVEVYAMTADGCVSDTASAIFDRKPLPVLTWADAPVNVKEGSDFTLKVTSSIPGVTYVWTYTFTPDGGTAEAPMSGSNRDQFEMIGAELGEYKFEVYAVKDGCEGAVIEKTVKVVSKDATLAVKVSQTSVTACVGGTAKVFATAENGDGKYVFKWYKGTTPSGTPVAEGDTVYLSLSGTSEKYVVEVTDNNGAGEKVVSDPVTVTNNGNFAPTAIGGVQYVAAGNATTLLSAVSDGERPYRYYWTPGDKLAAGEQGNACPHTQVLTANQEYTYYVADKNDCISQPAKVTVNVEESADAIAVKATTDNTLLCIGNRAHFNVVAVEGSLPADARYEWTPGSDLSAGNIAAPVFTATAAGVYEYVVKVTANGKTMASKVKVEVKNAQAPAIAWDGSNPTSYTAGTALTMKAKASGGAGSGYMFHWMKPSVDHEPNGMYIISTPSAPNYTFEVYVTDANGCASSDTLSTDITAGGGVVPIVAEAGDTTVCASADREIVELTAKVSSGHTRLDYDWTGKGNTIPLTDANQATVRIDIAGLTPGTYTFELKLTDQDHTDNTAIVEAHVTVQALPQAKIDRDTIVVCHKNDPFILNVVNSAGNTYLWDESVYDMVTSSWGTPRSKGTSNYVSGTMQDNDLRYVLTVTDNTPAGCQAYDTAYVYRIPDAPKVAIDTNTNALTAKLKWGRVYGADEYTIWSRKWDPYCMTAENGGKYLQEAGGTTTDIMWAEKQMDTLEFYYVTATRNINGKKYHSTTSDTVGYYLYDVHKNPNGKASLDFLPVVFDMSSNSNAYKASDFLKANKDIALVKTWKFATQSWAPCKYLNAVIGYTGDFVINVGDIVQIDPVNETQILQYGVLPGYLSALLERTNPTGKANLSFSCVWWHRLDLSDAGALLNKYSDVSIVKRWKFANQAWDPCKMLLSTPTNPFELRALLPLQFDLKPSAGSGMIWK